MNEPSFQLDSDTQKISPKNNFRYFPNQPSQFPYMPMV